MGFWAVSLIYLMTFVFGILFQDALTDFYSHVETSEDFENARAIHETFGGIYMTTVCLFSAISGGNDWMGYAELLRHAGEIYFCLFIFYIAFMVVGLLNVVTGIFVDSAVCARTDDEIVQDYTHNEESTLTELYRIFSTVDRDNSGA